MTIVYNHPHARTRTRVDQLMDELYERTDMNERVKLASALLEDAAVEFCDNSEDVQTSRRVWRLHAKVSRFTKRFTD